MTATSRRLAAILAADVAGYSRLMAADEVGTLTALKAARREVIDPAIAEHHGRIVKTTGDGMLVEFGSAVDAVTCAMAVQEAMAARDGNITFRIGINVGDIIIDDDDIFGDGVNVAARLENECKPGGVYLSAQAFDQIRNKTSFDFDDLGERQLKNIDRPVRIYAARLTASTPANLVLTQPGTPLPLPDRPSITVLPFQNMSGDPEQEYFADGIVEEIITSLSRFKSLFVIARNSSFTYKGKAVDIKQVGRELGVRYVLEGSVRRSGDRVRITGQLIEAETNNHLWADKFDGALEDVFTLQDQVAASVAQQVNPKIEQVEIQRTIQKPTSSLDSYDMYLRGLALVHKYDFGDEAHQFFQNAYRMDPSFAAAYAMDAFVLLNQQATLGHRLTDVARQEAIRLAETAVQLTSDDALVLARSAMAFAHFGHNYDRASEMVDRAVALNPNLAAAWHSRGWVAYQCCDGKRTIESFQQSGRLSPRERGRVSAMIGISSGLWLLERYNEGFELAGKALQLGPTPLSLTPYIANATALGRFQEAREAAQQLLKIMPNYRVSDLRKTVAFRDKLFSDRLAAHLRDAGLPE